MIHLPDFTSARTLVIGDIMLDRYWHGDTSRISPEAPVPVVNVSQAEERVGGAGNVALNMAALGAQVKVLGLVGADEAALALESQLADKRVTAALHPVIGHPTITKLRVLSRHQQLIRLDFEQPFAADAADDLLPVFESWLGEVDVVVLSDYAKGTLERPEQFIAAAKAAGCFVVVDPKRKDFSAYAGADLLTPNRSEFEAVVGKCLTEAELIARARGLIEESGIGGLLITRSEEGMTLLMAGEAPLNLPARAREVFDVTGAGDTVVAVFAAAYAAGAPLAEAAILANEGASVVVGKVGTATVSVAELQRQLCREDDLQQGVRSEEKLAEILQRIKGRGEKVVMTNGCFDILHPGHVAYLEQARTLGDRLVVAVNDDASVRRLKGEQRPINSLQQRMAVLAGLRSVDWVVPFTEDTPERLICQLQPDMLVKGGDYKAEEIAGYDCVKANGGEVCILDFLEGCSTTGMIESIRRL